MGKIRGSNKVCSNCFEEISGNKPCCSISYPPKKQKKSLNTDVKIRRTERVKKGRPDYFDILEYERQEKREKKERAKAKLISNKQGKNGKSNKVVDTNYQLNRMHVDTKIEKKKKVEVEPQKEEDLEEIVLSKETLAKFDLILQDINRKIYASSWRIYID